MRSITPLQAAKKMMKERGHIVLAFYKNAGLPALGQRVDSFAGKKLSGYDLVITGGSEKPDWDAQRIAIFGDGYADPEAHTDSTVYYKSELVESILVNNL